MLFFAFVTVKVALSTDPAKCQHFIRSMLINACGATKRQLNTFAPHSYTIMATDEIEQRYQELVEAGVIKGLDLPEITYPNSKIRSLESKHISADNNHGRVNDPLLFNRWKRDLFGPILRRYVAEPTNIERRGLFIFVGHPPSGEEYKYPLPVALVTKCCGAYLCSTSDFKGYCE